jgi:UDP-N-acetylmuramyl tripeptide synthase
VEVAILETARGGLLRRGLFVARARAALVTNVAADHLGEFGIHDVESLAHAKLLVTRAVDDGGRVVLNADDPVLVRASAEVRAPVAWFSRDPANPVLLRHLAAGGHGAYAEDGMLILARGAERVPMLRVDDVPATMGGAAAHNVSNALGAAALADAMGFDGVAITRGLRGFGARPEQNEGRLESYEVGGARVLVDFAHNPHAMRALVEVAAALPAARRCIVLGQAGDRDDAAIAELVETAAALPPDRVFVKEMLGLLRGRQAGEVPALVARALRMAGVPDAAVDGPAPTELDAVRRAFAWARPGDLLVLPVHKDRGAVMSLLRRLRSSGWTAGDPLPR